MPNPRLNHGLQSHRRSFKVVFTAAAFGFLFSICPLSIYSLLEIIPASIEMGVRRLVNPSVPSRANSIKPKARCILHIGPHKTSTTYILTKLCQERDTLKEMGYIVPLGKACEGKCSPTRFAGMAGQLRGNMEIARRFGCSLDPINDFKEALQSSGDANIILSSEGFDMLSDDHVHELANLLVNYQTTVVIYFRRKLGHLVSYYTQVNKHYGAIFPPLSFKEFIWRFLNDVDPAADLFDNPIPQLNGLCYTRMFETYGRYFGKDNLAVIDYNEMVDAGKDPWEIIVRDVMGFESYADKTKTTHTEGDHHQDKSKKINVSPDAFSLSVAGSFYQWRWTNLGLSAPTGPNAEEMTDISKQSDVVHNHTLLPRLECILPLLDPLKDMLPKTCSTLESVCSLWELHEKEALSRLAKEGSRLLYFKRDDDNSSDGKGKGSITLGKRNETVCEVDTVALTLHDGKRHLDEVFRQISTKVEQTCSGDMITPGGRISPFYMQK